MSTAESTTAGSGPDFPDQHAWGPLQWVGAGLAWTWVAVPFGYGLYQLLIKIPALFGS